MAGLKPEISLTVGLATAVLVFAIYQQATPSIADIRVGDELDPDIEDAERVASWTAAGTVAAVSLLAKDATVFILGGSMVIAMAWMTRHADAVNPLTGRAWTQGDADSQQFGDIESEGGRVDLAPAAG